MEKNLSFNFQMTVPIDGAIDYDKVIIDEFARHLKDFVKQNFESLPITKKSYNDSINYTKTVQFKFEMIDSDELYRLKEIERINERVNFNYKTIPKQF